MEMSGIVDVAGVPLAYRLDGRADLPVLVFSNSLGTDCRMWNVQVGELSQHFRLLRYDTRGHGRSGSGPSVFGIDTLGRDVIALMDALDIRRALFCGLSLGGMTGMWLGVNAPQRFHKLVLANTAAKVGTAEMWTTRATTVRKDGMSSVVDALLQRWFTADFASGAAIGSAPVLAMAREMMLDSSVEGYASACDMLAAMDQRASVAKIKSPTLVIAGRQDLATPPADAQFLAAQIHDARLVELDAAHLSNLERPAEFTAEVARFLLG
jgi:3-oxoadipate enol-lactonase